MGMEMDQAIGFSTTHIDCEMAKAPKDCHSTTDSNSKEDCCDEEYELLVLDQEIQKGKFQLDQSFEFVVAFVYTHLGLSLFEETSLVAFSDYPPPIPQEDLQILFQSFLI